MAKKTGEIISSAAGTAYNAYNMAKPFLLGSSRKSLINID